MAGFLFPMPAAQAAQTFGETTGGVTHTWTNYTNAGGTEGAQIAAYQTVQIACRVEGFRVSDGNTWWYRIASAPWSNNYYASADAFYNNGQTSGSLKGTPFYDPAVPLCGSNNPSPPPTNPPPKTTPTVTLAQGPAAPAGYRYAISLSGFAANTPVTVVCYDSRTPAFYTFTLSTNGSGTASTQSQCYSADGPDHWVLAGGVESNHVAWGGTAGQGPTSQNPPPAPANSSAAPPGPAPSQKPKSNDPCFAIGTGTWTDRAIFGGTETRYDRTASLYLQCEGFGAPDGLTYSPAMKCAMMAAVAALGGLHEAGGICDALGLVDNIGRGDWMGAVNGLACSMFADGFATAVAIIIAGATAETTVGAAVIGVASYRALQSFLTVACGGIFDGGASTFGGKLEAKHEFNVAQDIRFKGKCLRFRKTFGLVSWSAVDC
jgi:hypothetical protein